MRFEKKKINYRTHALSFKHIFFSFFSCLKESLGLQVHSFMYTRKTRTSLPPFIVLSYHHYYPLDNHHCNYKLVS
jgi:hypothetical protein